MKLRDVIVYSMQLFLPEKAIVALEKLSRSAPAVLPPDDHRLPAVDIDANIDSKSECLHLIEELDRAQFGGPSFGEQTILVMAQALEQAITSLPAPVERFRMRQLARKILDRAADGERNPDHLRQAALVDLAAPDPEQGG